MPRKPRAEDGYTAFRKELKALFKKHNARLYIVHTIEGEEIQLCMYDRTKPERKQLIDPVNYQETYLGDVFP